MNDYTVVIKVEICECKDKQEAIEEVQDNLADLNNIRHEIKEVQCENI